MVYVHGHVMCVDLSAKASAFEHRTRADNGTRAVV